MVWTIPLTAGCEVLRAWLNSRHMFVVPAAMTVILNVTAAGIVVAVQGDITILPIAYVAGSIAQFVLMFLYAVARGLRLGRPVLRDEEAKRLTRLTVRPSIAATLNPMVRAAELFVASFLPPGTATVLHYAHRLVHAIGGTVLFRQIMAAVLPRLTRAFVTEEPKADRLPRQPGPPPAGVGVVPADRARRGARRPGRDHRVRHRPVLPPRRPDARPGDRRPVGLVHPLGRAAGAAAALLRGPRHEGAAAQQRLRRAGQRRPPAACACFPVRNSDSAEEYALLGLGAAYVLANVVNVVHAWWRLRHSS